MCSSDLKILKPFKEIYFGPKIFAPGAKRKDAKILKPFKGKYFEPKIFAPGAKRKDAKILKPFTILVLN